MRTAAVDAYFIHGCSSITRMYLYLMNLSQKVTDTAVLWRQRHGMRHGKILVIWQWAGGWGSKKLVIWGRICLWGSSHKNKPKIPLIAVRNRTLPGTNRNTYTHSHPWWEVLNLCIALPDKLLRKRVCFLGGRSLAKSKAVPARFQWQNNGRNWRVINTQKALNTSGKKLRRNPKWSEANLFGKSVFMCATYSRGGSKSSKSSRSPQFQPWDTRTRRTKCVSEAEMA